MSQTANNQTSDSGAFDINTGSPRKMKPEISLNENNSSIYRLFDPQKNRKLDTESKNVTNLMKVGVKMPLSEHTKSK